MGSELAEARPQTYDRYLEAAEEASGLPLRRLSLEGPLEELTETRAAQPALFALSLAVTETARHLGVSVGLVAGHSLGEYTAAVAAGALSVDAGMEVVSLRGRLMSEMQSERPGAMAAIIGLSAEKVERLCGEAANDGVVAPANLNSPSQIVCSGEEAAVDRLVELAAETGAQKAIRLQVGAAFHSELMRPVQEKMADALGALEWRDPEVPMVSNASGGLATTAADVRQALVAQIASPVRWVECVRTIAHEGVTTALELGPGRVLAALVRQIEPELEVASYDSPAKLEHFVSSRSDRRRV